MINVLRINLEFAKIKKIVEQRTIIEILSTKYDEIALSCAREFYGKRESN